MGHLLLDSYGDLGAIVRGATFSSSFHHASNFAPASCSTAGSDLVPSSPSSPCNRPPANFAHELPRLSSFSTSEELVHLPSSLHTPHHYNQLLPPYLPKPSPPPPSSTLSSSMSSSEPFNYSASGLSYTMAMESFVHQLHPLPPMSSFSFKMEEATMLRPCSSTMSEVSTAMSGSLQPQTLADVRHKLAAETELSSSAISNNPHKGRVARRRKQIQKRVVHIPAVGEVSRRPNAGETVPTDTWAWRKYGQKPIKGSPYPRGYYRCSSSKGCPARKQVERNPNDPAMLVVTYTYEHNHPWPTHRSNSFAGSTRPVSPPPMAVSMTNQKLSPDCPTSNINLLSFDNMDDDASLLSQDDRDNDLVQGPSVLQGLEPDHGVLHEEAAIISAVNSAFTTSSAPYPTASGDNTVEPDVNTLSGSAASSPFMSIMMESNAGASKSMMQCTHDDIDVGHTAGVMAVAVTTLGEASSCVEDDMFDALLSEMLEEVQKQNRAKMELMMMMMDEGEGKAMTPCITWSNNINFVSQVNHVLY